MSVLGRFTVLVLVLVALCSFWRPDPRETWPGPAWVGPVRDRPSPLAYDLPLPFETWVWYYCDETGVPVWLASRHFSVESSVSGDPLDPRWVLTAWSAKGAQGPAQLLHSQLGWFAEMFNGGARVDPHDPETAMRVGIRYLAYLHGITGSWEGAVEAYNCGPWRWLKRPLPEETVRHRDKVFGGNR